MSSIELYYIPMMDHDGWFWILIFVGLTWLNMVKPPLTRQRSHTQASLGMVFRRWWTLCRAEGFWVRPLSLWEYHWEYHQSYGVDQWLFNHYVYYGNIANHWEYHQSFGKFLVVGISPVNSLFNMSFHKLLVQNGMPRSWAVIFPNILVRIVPELIINQQGFWTLLICAFHHVNLKWGYERNLRWLERYLHWARIFHKNIQNLMMCASGFFAAWWSPISWPQLQLHWAIHMAIGVKTQRVALFAPGCFVCSSHHPENHRHDASPFVELQRGWTPESQKWVKGTFTGRPHILGIKPMFLFFFQTIHLLDDSWSAPTFPIKNHGEIWDIQSIINYPINQSINQSVSIILSQSPSISIGSSSRFPSEKPPHFFVRNVHHEAIAGQGQSAGRNLCSAGWWEGGGFLTWRFHRFTHKNKGPVMGNFIG